MNHNKISVAVVGTGYWGKNLVRNFKELDCLTAVCDHDPILAEAYARQYNVAALSWSQILNSDDINAVVLAVPASLHAQYAKEALLVNKHVFVEKPISLDVSEAKELCDLAQKKHRILMVGHVLQYHPAYVKLKQIVESGDLGTIQYVYSNRLSLGKVRTEEDVLWSFAPHDISMILGLVNDKPSKLQVSKSSYISNNIADFCSVHMEFSHGVNAHVFVSWMHPVKEQKLVVCGEKGMAIFDDTKSWDEKLTLYMHSLQRSSSSAPEYLKHEAKNISLTPAEPLQAELKHFIDCVINNKQPLTNGIEALQVLEILQMATNTTSNSIQNSDKFYVHPTSIVDQNVTIGEGSKIWHFSHILPDCNLGKNTIVGQNVMIGPEVNVGDNCKIQNNVSLYKGVILGKGVFCGPSSVFTNVNNPRAEIERKNEFLITSVEDGVTIGANATIVCGVKLGKFSFIGAGAVVTKDVPAFALMVGNPARQIGWVSRSGERLGPDLVCPRDGKTYKLNNNELDEVTHEHIG